MGGLDSPRRSLMRLLASAAVLALLVFALPLFLDLPLIDPDEGLHASIAQEMVERGDWVTPRFLGKPFLDKPVLFTWTQAASIELFGMHEAAVRLPGLMFGLLAMVTTGILGWRMFGRTVGVVSAMLYATMLLPAALAQAASHDVALVPWASLAILLFWEADRATARRVRVACTLAVGVLLGLSCLTKGLVGVALVGVAYGSYLVVTRRLTRAACLRGLAALVVAGLVASTWYLAMESRNPGYLHYYFIERHLLGFTTATQRHAGKPWWYYVPILLAGGLPWITYLPAGVRDWWAKRGQAAPERSNGAVALLCCWLVGCTVLLSLAGSKLVTYTWPVFPAVAILVALVWGRMIEGKLSGAARTWVGRNLYLGSLIGPAVVPAMMVAAQEVLRIRLGWLAWTVAIAAALSTWVPPILWRLGRAQAALTSSTLAVAPQFVVVMAVLAPPAAHVNSARDLATHFNRQGRIPPQVVIAGDRVGSVVFYLTPELRSGLRPGQLQPVRIKRLAELPEPEPEAVIALAEWRVKRAERYLELSGVPFERTGRYRLYTPAQLKALTAACGLARHNERRAG